MRGTKLTAWQIPPIWNQLRENVLTVPENSKVLQKQRRLQIATLAALTEIANDVRGGLLETVGVKSSFSMDDGRCSVVLELPEKTDTKQIAQAIDMENIEAWHDADGKVRLAVNPWYSTKEVDQTVLSAVKVIHVLLGIHATNTAQPKSFKQKLIASIAKVIEIQQGAKRKTRVKKN